MSLIEKKRLGPYIEVFGTVLFFNEKYFKLDIRVVGYFQLKKTTYPGVSFEYILVD